MQSCLRGMDTCSREMTQEHFPPLCVCVCGEGGGVLFLKERLHSLGANSFLNKQTLFLKRFKY